MSKNPLPLNQAAELVGEWWLPGEPASVASGRLIYRPREELALEVVSGGAVFPSPSDPVPWVHGITVDGRRVTLRTCHLLTWHMNIPGGVFARAHVHQAFVGMHARSERELRFHALRARIANLPGWLDAQGLDVQGTFPQSGRINFRSGLLYGLGRVSGGVLLTASTEIEGEAFPAKAPRSVTLEQRAWVSLAPRRPRPFEELFDLAETFRGFLSFSS